MKTGSCECGAVSYEISGDLRPSVACHCGQCRKTSGHYWSATQVKDDQLKITKSDGLKWFRSSDRAERGFCTGCGASLFWRMDGEGKTSVGSGTLNGATGLSTDTHIFVADKGDYYDIEQNVEQLDKY